MYSFKGFNRFDSWSNAELQVHRGIQFTSASNPQQNMINFPCTAFFRLYSFLVLFKKCKRLLQFNFCSHSEQT